MTDLLGDIQKAVDTINAANLPDMLEKIKHLEARVRDLENQLRPFLLLLKKG